MISLDTETTGLDLRAGSARPFFITSCDELGEISYWEAEVDPETREVYWTEEDLQEIVETIEEADGVVCQNSKFDVTAIETILPELKWDWSKQHDTLIAGHLLASNQPHDLTSMALVYLGWNIKPLEDAIQQACNEARRIARSKYPTWKIASKGLDGMPSAKDSVWAFDMAFPKLITQAEGYAEDHPWWTVLQDYSNADSEVTLPLFKRQEQLMKERGLWEIYLERLKVLPVAFAMEKKGITLSKTRLEELKVEYKAESERAGRICTNIAKDYGYELELPKSGSNDSLHGFVFGCDVECVRCQGKGEVEITTNPRLGAAGPILTKDCPVCKGELTTYQPNMGLESPKKSKKTGKASFDKAVLEHFEATLPISSKPLTFIKNLKGKRSRDTALSYMEGYERFWSTLGNDFYLLHPSLNPTGTDTLRWSSQSPNEQNISKKEGFNLRQMFGPQPGREWWSLDYQNIELRIPAYESNERVMIDLFEKPDEAPYFGSYHLMNASIIYPDLFWPIADQKGLFKKKYASTWYQWVKNFGFAFSYGCMEATGDRSAHKAGAYQLVCNRLQEHSKLNQKMINYADKYGYVETIPDSEICPSRGYPVYCSRTNYGKISPTVPLNYHVQSTACWVMMRAMTKISEYLAKFYDCHLIMSIHDEVVLDMPKGRGPEPWKMNLPKIRGVQKLMEAMGACISIPLTTSREYHETNWAEGISV